MDMANLEPILNGSGNGSKPLRFGIMRIIPFVMPCWENNSTTRDQCTQPGAGIEILNEFCDHLKLVCNFIPVNHTMFGDKISGKWRGMIKQKILELQRELCEANNRALEAQQQLAENNVRLADTQRQLTEADNHREQLRTELKAARVFIETHEFAKNPPKEQRTQETPPARQAASEPNSASSGASDTSKSSWSSVGLTASPALSSGEARRLGVTQANGTTCDTTFPETQAAVGIRELLQQQAQLERQKLELERDRAAFKQIRLTRTVMELKKPDKSDNSSKFCSYCGEYGHNFRDCEERKNQGPRGGGGGGWRGDRGGRGGCGGRGGGGGSFQDKLATAFLNSMFK